MCYMRYGRGVVGVRELRQNLSVYLRQVKAGQTLEVKERGHRVAVLAPAGAKATALDRPIAAGRATAAARDLGVRGPPLAEVRRARGRAGFGAAERRRAREILTRVALVDLDRRTLAAAAALDP